MKESRINESAAETPRSTRNLDLMKIVIPARASTSTNPLAKPLDPSHPGAPLETSTLQPDVTCTRKSFVHTQASLPSDYPYEPIPEDIENKVIRYTEWRAIGPPANDFGHPGDIYVDVDPVSCQLYGMVTAGTWKEWCGATAKKALNITHPYFPERILGLSATKRISWYTASTLRTRRTTDLSMVLAAQARGKKRPGDDGPTSTTALKRIKVEEPEVIEIPPPPVSAREQSNLGSSGMRSKDNTTDETPYDPPRWAPPTFASTSASTFSTIPPPPPPLPTLSRKETRVTRQPLPNQTPTHKLFHEFLSSYSSDLAVVEDLQRDLQRERAARLDAESRLGSLKQDRERPWGEASLDTEDYGPQTETLAQPEEQLQNVQVANTTLATAVTDKEDLIKALRVEAEEKQTRIQKLDLENTTKKREFDAFKKEIFARL